MPNLTNISITFHTHNDDLDDDTVLHVFVKNRQHSDTSSSEGESTYIANLLAYQEHLVDGTAEINPYLGFAQNLTGGNGFGDPSTHTFNIPLRNQSPPPQTFDITPGNPTPPAGPPIPLEEVVLPVVNIHILPNGNDRWIFDYTLTFTFDDGRSFSSSSNGNGVTGIILDQDNRDHFGLCTENPFNPQPETKIDFDAVLTEVTLELGTHHDNKDNDTLLGVHIVNRLSQRTSQDIAVTNDLLHGQEFPDTSPTTDAVFPFDKKIVWSATPGGDVRPLASNNIALRDIVLPVVSINIAPNGHDRWIFDYRVTYIFTSRKDPSDKRAYYSTTTGVILDQDNHKHTGAYQGGAFPGVNPLPKPPLHGPAINEHATIATSKKIPLSFLQKKLDELINRRQGQDFHSSPINQLRLHNTGAFGDALPQSYYDLRSIEADPPPPGTVTGPNYQMPVTYHSAPTELGQLTNSVLGVDIGDLYLNDINSQSLTLNINRDGETGAVNTDLPLVLDVVFETGGGNETIGGVGGMDFSNFTLRIRLSLAFDAANKRVDVLNWVDRIAAIDDDDDKSSEIDKVITVSVTTGSDFDPGGSFQKTTRGNIFDTLSVYRLLVETTLRDDLNATVNSWLLGGVIDKGNTSPLPYAAPCVVTGASIVGDNLQITYTGPQKTFDPGQPANWPAGHDFTPGTLANIDHIVVLTMENRSFDHMLGYLSLPPEKGGLGRTDVDGLKGGEFNLLRDGTRCPSFPLPPGDTIFAPDPPHSYEPVVRAINNGKMDGFAQSYAEDRGPTVAPRIMGYHTAVNVPTFDAMARDFGLCHRWYAAHPGPTFCNRFYETTGRLNIDPHGQWEVSNSSPLRPVFTPTIFDHLTKAGVSWKYFEDHYCFLRFFEGHTFDSANIATFDDPVFGFENLARTGNLPSVTFIDPHFIELPPDGNCDGPPADIAAGQALIQKVVNAVVTGAAWDKTLLIVTYDEHGGFYDHVPPAPATPVDATSLSTTGVRVPAFFVSPWVTGGAVFGHDGRRVVIGGPLDTTTTVGTETTHAAPATGGHTAATGAAATGAATTAASTTTAPAGPTLPHLPPIFQPLHFDHTSILKTIIRRFLGSNPPYMSARVAAAQDLSSVLSSTPRTGPFLPFIPYNLVYAPSQMRLDVEGGSSAPGTHLWQYQPNDTPAQQFSLEDADDGFFYLRTHTGSLYVTVDVPAVPTSAPLGIKQDVKYPVGGARTADRNPDCQRWKLSSGDIVAIGPHVYAISSAAFPGKVLQPVGGSTQSGTAVVLDDPTGTSHSPLQVKNPWQVTSPLLPNTGLILEA